MHTTIVNLNQNKDNINYKCLIDTGADISLIHKSILKEGNITINETSKKIFSVNGDQLAICGEAEVQIVIGSKIYHHTFLVASENLDMGDVGILGFDMFQKFNWNLDASSKCLVDGVNHIPYHIANNINNETIAVAKEHAINFTPIREYKDQSIFKATGNLAHCVSTDLVMSAGLAAKFKHHFPNHTKILTNQNLQLHDVGIVAEGDRSIYYLITKPYHNSKPSYEDVHATLLKLKHLLIATKQDIINIPKLGCGLDQLNWLIVRAIIKDIFENSPIQVNVCHYDSEISESQPEELTVKENTSRTAVRTKGKITIPPRSQFLLEGKQIDHLYNQMGTHESDKLVIFTPEEIKIVGLSSARSITYEKQDKTMQIKLINITFNSIELPNKTVVGFAEKLFYDQECSKSGQLEKESRVNCTNENIASNESVVAIKAETERILQLKTDINIDHLSDQDQNKLREFINSYNDVFFMEGDKLGIHSDVVMEIDTGSAKPIRKPPYRLPYVHRKIVDDLIKDQLNKGVIRPSSSPWSSPIVIVLKKSQNGEENYRFCCDFRAVNEVTKADSYPLPNINDTLDLLSGAKYFTTLDLYSAYYQIGLHEESIPKTAFCTPNGLWEYVKVPMGLKNSPSVWQRVIDNILTGLRGEKVLVYIDDLIIWSSTVEDHLSKLKAVFDRLRKSNLKLKATKCQFLKQTLEYLGHTISPEGVSPTKRLVEAVVNYPAPQNSKQVRSFLGLSGYYRKFINNYASTAKCLTELTKKSVKFSWNSKHQEAFDSLKKSLTTYPILVYPDFNEKFILTSDASGTGLGAILSQIREGRERVIGYASRQLNKAESSMTTTEQEMLAVIFGLKFYNCYVHGQRILIRFDHRALQWLMNLPKPSCRQTRWALILAEMQYDVEHRSAARIQHVDALSRIKINAVTSLKEKEWEPINPLNNQEWEPIFDRNIIKNYQYLDDSLKTIIEKLQKNSTCDPQYALDDEKLLYKIRTPPYQHKDRLVAPKIMHYKILRTYHDKPFSGHGGIQRTTDSISRDFYWEGMHEDIKQYVQACVSCSKRKFPPKGQRAPLQRFTPSLKPMELCSIDIVGPMKPTKRNNRYLLTFVDQFTKLPLMIPLHNQTAHTVAKAFVEHVICNFGCPEKVLTDLGSNFTSKMFEECCKRLKIKHLTTTAYHPACNGAVERSHQTISNIISHYVNNETNWDEVIPYVSFAMRTAASFTTGFTPFYLLHNFEARIPFDDILEPLRADENVESHYPSDMQAKLQTAFKIVRQNMLQSAIKNEIHYNKKSTPVSFEVGDLVYLLTPVVKGDITRKHAQFYGGPHRIYEKTSEVNFRIVDLYNTDKKQIVHANRLKLFHTFKFEDFNSDMTLKESVNQAGQVLNDKNVQTVENDCPIYKKLLEKDCTNDETDFIVPPILFQNLNNNIHIPIPPGSVTSSETTIESIDEEINNMETTNLSNSSEYVSIAGTSLSSLNEQDVSGLSDSNDSHLGMESENEVPISNFESFNESAQESDRQDESETDAVNPTQPQERGGSQRYSLRKLLPFNYNFKTFSPYTKRKK